MRYIYILYKKNRRLCTQYNLTGNFSYNGVKQICMFMSMHVCVVDIEYVVSIYALYKFYHVYFIHVIYIHICIGYICCNNNKSSVWIYTICL